MCRLLAYLGPDIHLEELLHKPEHSLEKQAWQPKELREAKLNADGFGIAWYRDNGLPARYRQPIPIWNDPNLQDLSQSLQRKLWLAMVRSATPGLGTHHYNTQPFRFKQWTFIHNGYILDFAHTARRQFRHILHHEYETNIQGDTDSEYLFALFLHNMQQSADPVEAIKSSFETIKQLIGDSRALLNYIISDGQHIWASRYAINGLCPSLYYGQSVAGFPATSQLLVSEPLNDADQWQCIDDQQILTIHPQQAMTLHSL